MERIAGSTSFAARIVAWQRTHGRHDLPWQRARDAYRIWVSEIMLQQTQVSAVIPYYERFLQRFPDVAALAGAPVDDVMAAWAGLGYYSRARNLHRCAQAVVELHGGRFPASVDALAALPGIGRSTASAIAAFAFGTRAAILDGNVKRVLARHHAVDGFPGAGAVERRLWTLADELLPATAIEAYTQGLMDLGATLCTRSRPRCGDCPVAGTCLARAQGRTAELPAPRPVRHRPVRHATLAIIRDGAGAVLLEGRPPAGIWGGLVSLPQFEGAVPDEAMPSRVAERYGIAVEASGRLSELRHEFSHFSFVMHPWLARLGAPAAVADGPLRWVAAAEAARCALPAPIRRLLAEIYAA